MSGDLDLALGALPPDVAARVESILATVEERVEQSTEESTRRAYASDWRAFTDWCRTLGAQPLAAGPGLVAAFAAWMSNPDNGRDPYRPATIRRRLAAITYMHRANGLANPCDHGKVRAVLEGIDRTLGVAPARKRGVSTDDLRAACQAMEDRLIDLRDQALLLNGYAGGFRRSELSAFDVSDVEEAPEGISLRVARAKTDQQGKGHWVPILYGQDPVTCPVRAMRNWLNAAGHTDGALFRRVDRHGRLLGRMSPKAVAAVVKKRMGPLGHDVADFAGHSLRRGMATTAVRNGASDRTVRHTTRHRSTEGLEPYVEEGRRFEDPASSYLGL